MGSRAIVVAILALAAALQGKTATRPEDAAFFDSKVRPLLAARCFKCHSAESPKLKGGLRLDTRESALKGGDTGAVIVPGDPEKSLLVKAVRYGDPDLQMPPKEQMPAGEIAILVDWVKRGAPWSDAAPLAKPARKEKPITDEDRRWWAFVPVKAAALPEAADSSGWKSPVDRFLLAKLRAEDLAPAPEATRNALIRRATFDLHGLPPTPAEVDAFVADSSPDAWEKLVDRLLASPRYGERWARRWLDLVRYAESDGYKQDAFRPHAWPYRDYVIRSFNEDKPYDRFILEQLAGDEVAPDDPEVFVATGFLRHGIYEYNQRNVSGQWRDMLNEITDVTGDVFLGLGMGCARCHDHKFDPILQSDYFRLQSFFAAMHSKYDQALATPAQIAEAAKQQKAWEAKTREIRGQIAAIEEKYLRSSEKTILDKFLPELRAMFDKPAAERTPYETQMAEMIARQVREERSTIDGKIKGAEREKWSALKRQLADHDGLKPKEFTPALGVTDVGSLSPPTAIPNGPEVSPGFLTVLGGGIPEFVPGAATTGRRTALARWMARPDHPLTARVMVNRIWQDHFGRGLAAMTSDFGHLGEKPTHPELLDWLASEFVKGGWRLKPIHRLLMTSSVYRQASVHPAGESTRLKDPENRWLWRMNLRRLDAEEVRDGMLAVSGELDSKRGGPSVDTNAPRRTIYTKVMRNTRDPLLEAFDAPESFSSVPGRNATTTATQALLMINGRWTLERAQALARRLRGQGGGTAALVEQAYRLAYGRAPTGAERDGAVGFLGRNRVAGAGSRGDLPLVQAMPDRGGQAARFRSSEVMDRLKLPAPASFPEGEFTIEAVVILDSIYDDASVRVIASRWDGAKEHPGWSFGITSEKSKHQPRNLILQVVGGRGYEVVASDLRIALHKTHYVAASVTEEQGVTFYMQDLSDPEAPLRTANVAYRISRAASKSPFLIGGRDGAGGHGWDGLLDEVRLSNVALGKDQLLIHEGGVPAGVVTGHWRFEVDPGFFKDSAGVQGPLCRPVAPKDEPETSEVGLVDFCHVLLNSNEFLHVE